MQEEFFNSMTLDNNSSNHQHGMTFAEESLSYIIFHVIKIRRHTLSNIKYQVLKGIKE